MKLRLGDRVGYQGIDYQVDDILVYALADRSLYLARLVGPGQVRFLETATSDASGRVLVLTEIKGLDITTPPPATIYHRGESFLLKVSGAATVTDAGGDARICTLWRYRAAGNQFLHIEQWPEKVRMFAGASVHANMLEIRPATDKDSQDS
jgi:Domain of unknown function (DUF4178)